MSPYNSLCVALIGLLLFYGPHSIISAIHFVVYSFPVFVCLYFCFSLLFFHSCTCHTPSLLLFYNSLCVPYLAIYAPLLHLTQIFPYILLIACPLPFCFLGIECSLHFTLFRQ